MDYSVPQFVPYVLAWFAILGGIWALFDRAETVVRPELRERLSAWLTCKRTVQGKDWPALFAAMFDRVFGEKHLSRRCFRRSAIVSVLSVGIMILVTIAVLGAEDWRAISPFDELILIAIAFIGFAVMLNVFPDYVSLLETRLLIRFMSTVSPFVHPLVLIVDGLFTALLFFAVCWLASGLGYFLHILVPSKTISPPDPQFKAVLSMVINGATFWKGDRGALFGIFFYSTFSTSVWIWLFVASSLVVRLLSTLRLSVRKIGSIFDVENKPLRSIGFVSMVLVTVGFAVLLFVSR